METEKDESVIQGFIESMVTKAIELAKDEPLPHDVVLSRIKTPDGTILTSEYRHDYKEYIDKNGELYMIDGGCDYCRKSDNKEPATYMPIYADDDFAVVRTVVKRGTFDKDGCRIWKPICELTDEHLHNILKYNLVHGWGLDNTHSKVVCKEILYRREHGISLHDEEIRTQNEDNG